MKPRQRRMLVVAVILAAAGLATTFALRAFKENVLYFLDPSQIVAGEAPTDRVFHLGGMVETGSVSRAVGSMRVRFVVTDFAHSVPVNYDGLLPDLFREGQGIIARGRFNDGEFVADQVLAKHDENYLPPPVADSLKNSHTGLETP